MNIELKEITIKDLANGYQDNAENSVVRFSRIYFFCDPDV